MILMSRFRGLFFYQNRADSVPLYGLLYAQRTFATDGTKAFGNVFGQQFIENASTSPTLERGFVDPVLPVQYSDVEPGVDCTALRAAEGSVSVF